VENQKAMYDEYMGNKNHTGKVW